MTQLLTERQLRARPGGGPAAAGATAALLGLAATGVPVLCCWLLSAPPQDGVLDAARLAGAVWLLAHGGPLLREPGGAPLSITPLALTAACVLLIARAGARAAAQAPPGRTAAACGALCAGYLAVALPVALGCRGAGALRAQPLPDLLAAAALAWSAACLGARGGAAWWRAFRSRLVGRLGRWPLAPRSAAVQEEPEEADEAEEVARRLPAWLRRCCRPLPAGVVLPTVGAGLLVLLAGGVLLLAVAAALRPVAIEVVVREVAAGSLAGQLGLLLCCLLVLPNAALWAVGYALGPGFWLGGDSLVAAGRAHLGAVPDFPLLVLAPEAGSAWQHLAQAVPVLAALTVAALLGRAAAAAGTAPADTVGGTDADGPWSNATTARTAAAVALLLAAAVAVAGWLAGGALGAGRMARLGPAAACGPAAAVWCLLLAVPGALAVRWWSLRRARAGEADGEWAAAGR
ncbi:hypothetical protein E6W39_26140 [Kitasatospora acidiphila]|uniref:Integral membrane protein n=1 Tax=Kitasatospora acidiphila TaxID=2567942 RepID=A0A540W7U9_9ACTN|nr:DUF6350 family protein [Kitasatospora acidiphila]TQF05078.1 hypothetical protein E6W39_26140 [Kitasatospora acidiphila]